MSEIKVGEMIRILLPDNKNRYPNGLQAVICRVASDHIEVVCPALGESRLRIAKNLPVTSKDPALKKA